MRNIWRIKTSVSVPLPLSDSAVKQILLTLDERPGQSFIIEDLDEFHVLIRADEEQRVRRELETEVRCCPDATSSFMPDVRPVGEEHIQHGGLVLARVAATTKNNHPFHLPIYSLRPFVVVDTRRRITLGMVPKE